MNKTAINDITKDKIKSKPNSKEYTDNYDKIFRPESNKNYEITIDNSVVSAELEITQEK